MILGFSDQKAFRHRARGRAAHRTVRGGAGVFLLPAACSGRLFSGKLFLRPAAAEKDLPRRRPEVFRCAANKKAEAHRGPGTRPGRLPPRRGRRKAWGSRSKTEPAVCFHPNHNRSGAKNEARRQDLLPPM